MIEDGVPFEDPGRDVLKEDETTGG